MKKAELTKDRRIDEISQLLVEYSLGNFEKQLPISADGDGIDAIIAGVNMLGEELQQLTYSRDSLNRIYNSISEMLFVLDMKGKIEDANAVAAKKLGLSKYDLLNENIFKFIQIKNQKNLFNENERIKLDVEKIRRSGALIENEKVRLNCVFSLLRDVHDDEVGILLIAEDITDKEATEKLIIRTIIETQEKERNRTASDLHDSLGQQISGMRFYLNALHASLPKEEKVQLHYRKALSSIDNALSELRDICFNLMPRTLENHTLHFSLEELASKFINLEQFNLKIDYQSSAPALVKNFEIAAFRIVQEFLNNALKHGNAQEVVVKIYAKNEQFIVDLSDNGKGFDVDKAIKKSGMGLRNIATRVDSYYGKFQITSKETGTNLHMTFPLRFVTLQ